MLYCLLRKSTSIVTLPISFLNFPPLPPIRVYLLDVLLVFFFFAFVVNLLCAVELYFICAKTIFSKL